MDFGAPCSPDGGSLPPPGFCGYGPKTFVGQICVETLPGAGYRSTPELCNDQCRCPFGATCVAESAMRFCIKVCYAPTDCRGDQICHRFAESTVSACVSPSMKSWFLPSDFRPSDAVYRAPASLWRDAPSYRKPTAAELFRQATEAKRLLGR